MSFSSVHSTPSLLSYIYIYIYIWALKLYYKFKNKLQVYMSILRDLYDWVLKINKSAKNLNKITNINLSESEICILHYSVREKEGIS